jgi:hypothetical protein
MRIYLGSTIDLIPGESSGSNVMEPPADIQNKPDTFPKEERRACK